MLNNNNLTQKERLYLQDALQIENLHMAKCSVYADQCQNQELKSLMFDVMKSKRQHANKLKQLLGQNTREQSYQQFH